MMDTATIEALGPKKKPTGQVIGRLTIESNGQVTWDIALDGPNSCGIKVYELPVTAKETKISFHFARGHPPLWWNKKLQDVAMQELHARSVYIQRLYRLRQQKVQPTGYREDV